MACGWSLRGDFFEFSSPLEHVTGMALSTPGTWPFREQFIKQRSPPLWFCWRATQNRTVNTSGQVINLNTNTAFKCVPHILGYLQFLQTVAELCADAHYYFAHSLNSPWGSNASSMCPVRHILTSWATRVGLRLWGAFFDSLLASSYPNKYFGEEMMFWGYCLHLQLYVNKFAHIQIILRALINH